MEDVMDGQGVMNGSPSDAMTTSAYRRPCDTLFKEQTGRSVEHSVLCTEQTLIDLKRMSLLSMSHLTSGRL